MKDYICQNFDCGETWETNHNGNLIPMHIKSGSWKHISDSNNCPACDEGNDWEWINEWKGISY